MERVLRLSRIGKPIHWPYTLVDWLRSWRLLPLLPIAFLIAVFIATLPKAFSQTNAFYVTIDSPGSDNEQSTLVTNPQQFSATQVHEETFNELTSGLQTNGFNFAGSASIGSYSAALIVKADQYGGAGGTGNYMTVNTSLRSPSSTTLTFVQPQRYFGL